MIVKDESLRRPLRVRRAGMVAIREIVSLTADERCERVNRSRDHGERVLGRTLRTDLAAGLKHELSRPADLGEDAIGLRDRLRIRDLDHGALPNADDRIRTKEEHRPRVKRVCTLGEPVSRRGH